VFRSEIYYCIIIYLHLYALISEQIKMDGKMDGLSTDLNVAVDLSPQMDECIIVKRVAMSARVSRELRANVLCHDLSV